VFEDVTPEGALESGGVPEESRGAGRDRVSLGRFDIDVVLHSDRDTLQRPVLTLLIVVIRLKSVLEHLTEVLMHEIVQRLRLLLLSLHASLDDLLHHLHAADLSMLQVV
jgi:hypothetical protein